MASVNQSVSVRQAAQLMEVALLGGLVPHLSSSPGVGKSSIVKQFAEKHNLKLIDLRLSTCAPEDLNGLPAFVNGKAVFHPFDVFPLARDYPEGTTLPINPKTGKPYNGWLLFLDEFKSAPRAVIAAAYRLVLDRQVGLHDLHPRVAIVAASNLMTDRALVNDPGTAMQSRMVHLILEPNAQDWIEDVAIPLGFDYRIISFISQHPNFLMDFVPDHKDLTFSSPRTWAFVNNLLKAHKGDLDMLQPLLSGTITSLMAINFIEYCRVLKDIVPVSEILADPENCRLPVDVSLQWATITAMTEALNQSNFKKLADYADRFSLPMRIVFYRMCIARKPEIQDSDTYAKAMDTMAQYLNS